MDDEFARVLAELQAPESSTVLALEVLPAPEAEPTYVEEKVEVRVRNLLGIKKESWDRIMPKVRELVPKYATRKITARLTLNMGFTNLGQLAQAVEIAKQIMEKPGAEDCDRVAAGRMMSNAVEAMAKMFGQLAAMAETAGDKTAEDEKPNGAPKPKNLPPQLNVQVNVGGSPASPSPNGGPPALPVGAVVKSGNGPRNLPPKK